MDSQNAPNSGDDSLSREDKEDSRDNLESERVKQASQPPKKKKPPVKGEDARPEKKGWNLNFLITLAFLIALMAAAVWVFGF